MKDDIIALKKEFTKIKNLGLIKSMRKGSSGLGYTFETLLNKEEDQLCQPDFGTIELKCKLKYTNYALTLFNCSPLRNDAYATRYILDKYGYYNSLNCKNFSRFVFSKYSKSVNGYEFKLKVDYNKKFVFMQSYFNSIFLENVCSWSFKVLENKLTCKISNLALVYANSYNIDGERYYKYTKMFIYKLKSFDKFLELLNNDKIYVAFYMKEGVSILGNPQMDTHGVAFKIKKQDISKLYNLINF